MSLINDALRKTQKELSPMQSIPAAFGGGGGKGRGASTASRALPVLLRWFLRSLLMLVVSGLIVTGINVMQRQKEKVLSWDSETGGGKPPEAELPVEAPVVAVDPLPPPAGLEVLPASYATRALGADLVTRERVRDMKVGAILGAGTSARIVIDGTIFRSGDDVVLQPLVRFVSKEGEWLVFEDSGGALYLKRI
jgi:hypothetical protein